MSLVERNRYRHLIYVDSRPHLRDVADRKIINSFSKLVKINTAGTENNIPEDGSLVVGFAPHSGFLETALIDRFLEKRRHHPAVWMTKKESEDAIPGFLRGYRRLIYVDRKNPGISTVRAVNWVLSKPGGTVGSAFEGTRFANPEDPHDVLTLGEFKPGLMRFAVDAGVPIMGVVVFGVHRVLPSLDKTLKEKGSFETIRLLLHCLGNPPDADVRFLTPYQKHLTDERRDQRGTTRTTYINEHNENLGKELIGELLNIKPDYPLGYYRR